METNRDDPGRPGARRTRSSGAPLALVAVALLAAAMGLTGCGADDSSAPDEPSPGAERRVIAQFGDSLAFDSRAVFEQRVAEHPGHRAEVSALPGSATCDYVPFIADAVAAKGDTYAAAVLAFSGNAEFSCMLDAQGASLQDQAYLDAYADATREAITILTDAGIPTFVVTGIPRPGEPVPRPLDRTLERVVAAARDAGRPVDTIDLAPVLAGPDGEWQELMECIAGEGPEQGCRNGRIRVHTPELGVHMWCPTSPRRSGPCAGYSSGDHRYAGRQVDAVFARLDGGWDQRP